MKIAARMSLKVNFHRSERKTIQPTFARNVGAQEVDCKPIDSMSPDEISDYCRWGDDGGRQLD